MRFRARAPDGRQVVVQLDDTTATVSTLRRSIQEQLDMPHFELKAGFPPRLIKLNDYQDTALLTEVDVKLNNESVQVIPPSTPQPPPATSDPSHRAGPRAPPPAGNVPAAGPSKSQSNPRQETPEIPIPSESATLILRVMPDDNSCLFRAIATALSSSPHESDSAVTKLRWHCADYIQSNPSIYSKAILGKDPAAYCAWIQQGSAWGGDIELDILSRVLGVEIDACIVAPFTVQRYNEGAADRIVLVYSGIHYDTVAVSPDPEGDLGTDFDMRRFPVEVSDYVLQATERLCRRLAEQGYMTNTATFGIRCNICGWQGNGEREAAVHATKTGHVDLEEIRS
jgi:ubiquitin thioesterase OTU1